MARSFRNNFTKVQDVSYFMKEHFEVTGYCNSRYESNEKNLLIRFNNAIVKALNEKQKLPQYIVVALDDDIVHFAQYDGFGISRILGEFLDSMAKALDKLITDRKQLLPSKSVRDNFPMVFWVALPMHHNLLDSAQIRSKFNMCLDSVLQQYSYMRVIRLKEIWNYNDGALVSPAGIFAEKGYYQYWRAIDASVRFNVTKLENSKRFIPGNRTTFKSVSNWSSKAQKDLDFEKIRGVFAKGNSREETNERRDSFTWRKTDGNRFMLPRPPSAKRRL